MRGAAKKQEIPSGTAFESLVRKKLASKKKSLQKKEEMRHKIGGIMRSGAFVDKRIGEYNKNLSQEKKMTMRFAKERIKARKTKKFDLGDDSDEIGGLTHLGKNLDEIQDDFKEKISDNSDADEDHYKETNEELATKLNFGEGGQKMKTRREVFEEIMLRSKMKKAERSRERMETQELTHKLNSELPQVMKLLKKRTHPEQEAKTDYEKLHKSLQFED